jgi:hypothetical protein
MPRSKQFLLEQTARAQRFAQAMNTVADRERFEKTAADLRTELDAAEPAEGQESAVSTASEGAGPTDDAAAAQQEAGGPGATAPEPRRAEADDGLADARLRRPELTSC